MDEFDCITLGELIAHLEKFPASTLWENGFGSPHSYRGYYRCLAFEPRTGVTVAEMLEAARSAVGTVYEGWKGGDFLMTESTRVWLAQEGDCGVPMRLNTPEAFVLPAAPG